MPTQAGPTIPRRRIAAELRRLRTEAGLLLEQVAEELLISTSKLSRLENAQGSPQLRDVRDLIQFYGVAGTPVADKLTRWVRSARQQGWWENYEFEAVGSATGIGTHVEYESEAAVARIYTLPFIPALLQTARYTEASYKAIEPWRSSSEIDQLVQLRRRRQQVLETEKPLRLHAVMHECCIAQQVGGRDVMKEQLTQLVQYADRPNIDLRILPFRAPPPFACTTMWAHLEFGDSFDRDVVHIETHAGFRYLETPAQVAQYRRHFDEIERRSLSAAETRDRLLDAADTV
jgi:transcriptional regulator with XRE-family HTH domain